MQEGTKVGLGVTNSKRGPVGEGPRAVVGMARMSKAYIVYLFYRDGRDELVVFF